jgi:hypothetical protein
LTPATATPVSSATDVVAASALVGSTDTCAVVVAATGTLEVTGRVV